jgi:aryl-alcohol dehydrogenase-like predicted oxidoreductase
MDYRQLGNSDLLVSRLCLGTLSFGDPRKRAWTLDEAASRKIIRSALDKGINFFDTANSYMLGESERILGAAIQDFTARHEVVIASKVGLPVGDTPGQRGLSRRHIMSQVDESLRRLRTDYIDLYQLHRWDYTTPIEETLDALASLVQAGKVRHLGASSMFAWQFAKLQFHLRRHDTSTFVSMQAQYNLAYREEEREMIPFCESEAIALIPWSPLARGFLTGTRTREGFGTTIRSKSDELEHKRYHGDVDFDVLDRVVSVANTRRISPAQIALAWVLSKPIVVSPIIGVTRPGQLEQAIEALSVTLSAEEVHSLESPYRPRTINDHD